MVQGLLRDLHSACVVMMGERFAWREYIAEIHNGSHPRTWRGRKYDPGWLRFGSTEECIRVHKPAIIASDHTSDQEQPQHITERVRIGREPGYARQRNESVQQCRAGHIRVLKQSISGHYSDGDGPCPGRTGVEPHGTHQTAAGTNWGNQHVL